MKLTWLAVVLALMASLAAPVVFRRNKPISEASYRRIQIGMTRTQVEEILGGLPRREAPLHHFFSGGWYSGAESWVGESGIVLVWFDMTDTVYNKEFADQGFHWVNEPTYWDRLRTLLHW
jgi:hypothetical protein